LLFSLSSLLSSSWLSSSRISISLYNWCHHRHRHHHSSLIW
jgi:hypothetical protein